MEKSYRKHNPISEIKILRQLVAGNLKTLFKNEIIGCEEVEKKQGCFRNLRKHISQHPYNQKLA